MFVLITYDVNTESSEGRKRLRQIAKQCQNYGQRVQNSVFECNIEPALFCKVKTLLCDLMDNEKDSVRFYYLGNDYNKKVEHYGVRKNYAVNEPLIL